VGVNNLFETAMRERLLRKTAAFYACVVIRIRLRGDNRAARLYWMARDCLFIAADRGRQI